MVQEDVDSLRKIEVLIIFISSPQDLPVWDVLITVVCFILARVRAFVPKFKVGEIDDGEKASISGL